VYIRSRCEVQLSESFSLNKCRFVSVSCLLAKEVDDRSVRLIVLGCLLETGKSVANRSMCDRPNG
jgi:hypothetical protein